MSVTEVGEIVFEVKLAGVKAKSKKIIIPTNKQSTDKI